LSATSRTATRPPSSSPGSCSSWASPRSWLPHSAAPFSHCIVRRVGTSRILSAVTRIDVLAITALAIIAFARVHRPEAVIPPLFLFVTGQGFLNPNATVGALSRHAAHAGSASALMGMAQFLLGAISGLLVGVFTDGTPRGMAALMLAGALGMAVCDRFRTAAMRDFRLQ
jgi:MFS transporter, DHA1 family, multidrug resistance protein